MASCVACLRCGHKFTPQIDSKKKKIAPCPRCGATELLELVGQTALDPPPHKRPETPPAVTEIAPGMTPASDAPAIEDEIPPVAHDTVAPPRPLPHRQRSSRPTLVPAAVAAVVLLLGGYFVWNHFRSDSPVASVTAEGPVSEPVAAEEPHDADNTPPSRPEAGDEAAVVEPDEPVEPVESATRRPDPFRARGNPGGLDLGSTAPQPEPAWPMNAAPSFAPADETAERKPPNFALPDAQGESSVIAKPAPTPAAEFPSVAEPPLDAETLTVEPPPAPPEEPTPQATPVEPIEPRTNFAASLDEALGAIVKFELPLGIGNLTEYGAGFLVDARGWVATNNHVAKNITTDARVRMSDGTQLRVEGILGRSPSRDLALVKLADPPKPLALLDIRRGDRPSLGENVYAFGHPYQADFSLSKGIVGRVLTTGDLLQSSASHLVRKMGAPSDMVWVQHDAKISPGNSGGPLMDAQGHVLGVNTFVNRQADFGYASDVRYLRQLVADADGTIEPPPPPREHVRTRVSAERIRALFKAADTFAWKPATAEQYDELAELAQQMTLAKHALAVSQGAGKTPPPVVGNVGRLADEAFAAMAKASWGAEQLTAFNTYAPDQVDETGQGVIFQGVVWDATRQPDLVLMAIHGNEKPALVQLAGNVAGLGKGSRWLVLGFVTPKLVQINIKGRPDPQRAHLVLVYYMLPIR